MAATLYRLLAYAAAMVTLLYLAGFSGNLLVPKSVDVGGSGLSWAWAVAVDVALLALFGVQHSVMARQGFKRWWTRVVPAATERSTFLLASCAALAVLFWWWVPIEAPIVWAVTHPVGVGVLWALFGTGWVLALASTYFLDHLELFGLRAAATPVFRTPWLYRHVRHPLYLGFLLSFWAVPVMTAGRLLFAAGMSVYILVGIAFEERDLVRVFGERYRAYRARVGMLIPRA